jgi:hypothetical protein
MAGGGTLAEVEADRGRGIAASLID